MLVEHLSNEFTNFGPKAASFMAELRRKKPIDWPMFAHVGDTPLLRLTGFEQCIKERREALFSSKREESNFQIWIKVEGLNFTSTHKDRASLAHCLKARKLGMEEITIASCGNAGESLAAVAASMGIKCRVFLPASISIDSKVIEKIKSTGATIVRVDGNYDDAVVQSRIYAAQHSTSVYDANSSGKNIKTEYAAYATIAQEIIQTLHREGNTTPIASISGPVGNGAFFVGLHRGFLRLFGKKLISEIPQFIGGTNNETNPLLVSFTNGDRVVNTSTCSLVSCPVLAPISTDSPSSGNAALNAIRNTNGTLRHVDKESLEQVLRLLFRSESDYLRDQNVRPILAGLAGLRALFDELTSAKNPKVSLNGLHIAIITGIHD